MKIKLFFALILSVLAAHTFAADGFDRTGSATVAEDGYDRTGFDHTDSARIG